VDAEQAAAEAHGHAAEGAHAEPRHGVQADDAAADRGRRPHLHQRLRHGVEGEFQEAGGEQQGERTGMVTPPPMSLWGLTRPEHLAFAGPREVRQPYATLSQRIRLVNQARIPRTFIYCSSPATGSFDSFAAQYRNDPAWRFHELKTGHDAMLLMPEAVTQILLEKAAVR